MRKILIISSELGSGHKAAAEALAEEINSRNGAEARIVDFSEVAGEISDSLIKKTYLAVIRIVPFFWNFLSKVTNTKEFLILLNYLYFPRWHKAEKILSDFSPNAVISVFPVTNWFFINKKKKFGYKFFSVITDLIKFHACWAMNGADAYLVATKEAVKTLNGYNVTKSRIIHEGYPLRRGFFMKKDKLELFTKLGLRNDVFTVIYFLNTAPDKFYYALARKLDEDKSIQQIVVCGKNKEIYSTLKAKLIKSKVVGFVHNIDEYMRVADALVSKAGPGILMEAIALGKPLIITNYIKPQETPNVEYVVTNRLGFYSGTVPGILDKIGYLQKMDTKERADFEQKILSFSIRDSTKKIVDLVFSLSSERVDA